MPPKTGSVVALFDAIAPAYDWLNRIISWGNDQKWRRNLSQRIDLKPGQIVLDISAGTGDMDAALRDVCPRIQVIGLDPSLPMLKLYRSKVPGGDLTLGLAESISLKSASVSRAVCAFGVRNFMDRSRAFKEISRILQPSGLWGFLEMAVPGGSFFSGIYGLYFKRIVPFVGSKLSSHPDAYHYLSDSVYEFPGIDVLKEEHTQAGFELYYYKSILNGAVGIYVFKKEA